MVECAIGRALEAVRCDRALHQVECDGSVPNVVNPKFGIQMGQAECCPRLSLY